MMKQMILPGLAFTACAPALAQPAGQAEEYVREMRDAVAAGALPQPTMDARLLPAAADAAALPPGWLPATAQSWQQQTPTTPASPRQGRQQGWQQPPPVQVVHNRQMVPVPVPVAYGGWGDPLVVTTIGWRGGYGSAWNRGYQGGWGGHGYPRGPVVYYGGPYGRGWGRCRNTGGGALVGGIAGATIGYGLNHRRDRTPGVIIGGLVGALAGSVIERSGC